MTRTRLGKFIPAAIFLLSAISCSLFTGTVEPTQIVDLPPMVGKSLQEMTTMLGPSKAMGICHGWDLTEGELSVCYDSRDSAKEVMKSIGYRFTPIPSVFGGGGAALSSPEEMAKLVKIDLQGRKPDVKFREGFAYDDLILNSKAVDVAFDGGPKGIVGVRVQLK